MRRNCAHSRSAQASNRTSSGHRVWAGLRLGSSTAMAENGNENGLRLITTDNSFDVLTSGLDQGNFAFPGPMSVTLRVVMESARSTDGSQHSVQRRVDTCQSAFFCFTTTSPTATLSLHHFLPISFPGRRPTC